MIQSMWDSISSAVYSFLQSLINLLPDSPFQYLQQTPEINQVLRWINWIIPIEYILSTMVAWLTCITVYYTWSIVLRWIKAVD